MEVKPVAMSTKPWGSFSAGDYSDAQWSAACLIHRAGPGTPKQTDSLPVKEPDGTVNINAIHAAAGALAGARGGLKGVSPADKKKAARALSRLYGEAKEPPPDSLKRLAAS